MMHLLRPFQKFAQVGLQIGLMAAGVGLAFAPSAGLAQSTQLVELLQGTSPLLLHNSSQGYLGVDFIDVDQEKATALKLKEVRGAIITLIDHDAPAGQIGMRVNDVVLQLNGQNVEGAEQLKRMLKEIPPGRKVSLEFSRDGNIQTTSVQLVDHRAMEHDVWNKLGHDGDVFNAVPGMGVLSGGGDAALPGMFHMPIFGSTLNVGALVEPLTGQMADYVGVPSGLMVKQVAKKSEAATAGLKAFDIILKVGPDAITTLSDWDRALRANQGKPVTVTILRDKKQQTLTLQVDSSKHKTGALEMEELFPAADSEALAELSPDALKLFADQSAADMDQLRDQAQVLKDQTEKMPKIEVDPNIAEDPRKQAEQFKDAFKANAFKSDGLELDNFKIDQKQLDELKKQME